MSQLCQMDADLICPAGFQPAFQQRLAASRDQRLHMRDRELRVTRVGRRQFWLMLDAASLAVSTIADEVGADRLCLDPSANDGPINSAGCPSGELLRQSIASLRRPRDDQ